MSKKTPPPTSSNAETGLVKSTRPKMFKTKALINYQFSLVELAEKSQELARHSIEKQQILKDKKQIADEYKSKESACDAQIALLSQKIQNRYEMRRMDVMCHKDFENHVKIYYDIMSGQELQRDRLTTEDYQLDLEEQEATSKVN